MKRFAAVTALLFSSQMTEAAAEESVYKVKIHKEFIKYMLDTNFPVVLRHLENKAVKNKYITESNIQIDEFKTSILPQSKGDWNQVLSDLFFDQGELVMEIEKVLFNGQGVITDPETGVQEKIFMTVDMDLCQIVMRLETDVVEGNVYPKIEIKDVAFTLDQKTFKFTAEGDLPLYKTHKFEEGIKQWLVKQLQERERQFLQELQAAEREIMNSFAFKKDIAMSGAIGNVLGKRQAHSSLSQMMKLEGDHIVLEYLTEFEGADLQYSAQSMRRPAVEFSNDDVHRKDVQIAIDENQINYFLFSLFYADKPFSLTEKLLENIPEWLEPAAFLVKAVMNAQTFSPFFPELKKYGTRRLDLRCNFDKQSLVDGDLEEQKMSQVQFKDGNKVSLDLHFGCQTWLYEDHIKIPAMQEFMDFILDLYDDNPEKWEKHRSFYISMDALLEFDFSEDAKTISSPGIDWVSNIAKQWNLGEVKFPKMSNHAPLVFGRIVEFQPNIHELKMFKGQEEVKDEAESLNKAIMDARNHEFWENPYLQPILELFFGHTIPLAPFPQIEGCLGLSSKDSSMSISEGIAHMSFDYQIKQSNEKCLFEMSESKLRKEARRLKVYEKTPWGKLDKKFKKLIDMADQKIVQKMPPLEQLISHPTVQQIVNIASDENAQKQVMDAAKNLGKFGQKIQKGFGDLMGKGKGKGGLGNMFVQK